MPWYCPVLRIYGHHGKSESCKQCQNNPYAKGGRNG